MQPSSAQTISATAVCIALLGIVAWLLSTAANSYEPAETRGALTTRLVEISGINGANCGTLYSAISATVQSTAESEVISCVRTAIETRSPFWYVEEHSGIDDLIVIGTAGDPQGRIWRVSYSEFASFPTPDQMPPLIAKPCLHPILALTPPTRFNCEEL